MVVLLTFILAGYAPETLALVRDRETCDQIAKGLNMVLAANKQSGALMCRETRVERS